MESLVRRIAAKLGLVLAPFGVPIKRRLQTFGALIYVMCVVVVPILGSSIILITLFTPLWFLSIGYIIWTVYDMYIARTHMKGGRRSQWMRESRLLEWVRDYFPITLVKTCDLDPNRNYLMGFHPHGIYSISSFVNFASEAVGFREHYPGIRVHLCTLTQNLWLPFLRGYLLWMGVCDVSRESIEWIVTKQGKGNAAVIVVGGAEEALEAKPGNYKLTLKRRKGFVKLALKTGSSLVPVFSFGENDIYNQADNPVGSKLRKFQELCKKLTGISPPIFYGRGVFNYSFGMLPHRRPIFTVVGKPIHLDKEQTPTQDRINEVHSRYMTELTELFNEHKVKYGISEDTELEFY